MLAEVHKFPSVANLIVEAELVLFWMKLESVERVVSSFSGCYELLPFSILAVTYNVEELSKGIDFVV